VSEVTCPRCHTRQALADESGYTCTGCGTSWMFAACDNCGSRFHMRPGTTAWTCPECGHEHGSATMVDLAPEPEPERIPATVIARHAAAPNARTKRRPTRRRLTALAALGIAAVLVTAFALSSFGAEKDAAASPPPSSGASPSVTSTQALCLHLRDLQTPRVDALTRLAATLGDDAATIEAEGNAKLATAVRRTATAVLAYVDALAAKGDLTEAGAKLAEAVGHLPC
jgi:transcription elongation factor Elf1